MRVVTSDRPMPEDLSRAFDKTLMGADENLTRAKTHLRQEIRRAVDGYVATLLGKLRR